MITWQKQSLFTWGQIWASASAGDVKKEKKVETTSRNWWLQIPIKLLPQLHLLKEQGNLRGRTLSTMRLHHDDPMQTFFYILSTYSQGSQFLQWAARPILDGRQSCTGMISALNKICCSAICIAFSSPQTSGRIRAATGLSCVTDLPTRHAKQTCLSGAKLRNTAVYTKKALINIHFLLWRWSNTLTASPGNCQLPPCVEEC